MTTLILILAFQNIAGICNYIYFFFVPLSSNIAPTFLVFAMAFLGIITGMLYSAFFRAMLSGKGGEEDDENF
ncbi:hypothetical protein HZA41_02565 [Candidatus Peregrinibacteria bacterium]|nr:hypothetical protein [Candidatus Peregrinibacteria bacterium]